jgi:hypothetical protein
VNLGAAGRLPNVASTEVQAFHRDRERCYTTDSPDARAEAFARLHLDWFRRWGLSGRLESAIAPFPELPAGLAAFVFRRARGRHDEGAELYEAADGLRRAVLALRPDRFLSEPGLSGFIHHELALITDMISPAYGYSPNLGDAGMSPARLRLAKERYRILWAIRADGRLAGRGLLGRAGPDERRAEFGKAFGFLPEPGRSSVFQALWDGSLSTHAELVRLAVDPRGHGFSHEATPGAPCPLCGFPAFSWSNAASLRPAAAERIAREFPDWNSDEPICARCAEIYNAVTGIEYPPTVCVS